MSLFINKVICQECNGSGYLHQYKHIDNGICFTCSGTGLTEEYSDTQQDTPNPKEYYKQYKLNKQREQQDKTNNWNEYSTIKEDIKKCEHNIKRYNSMIIDDESREYFGNLIQKREKELAILKNKLNELQV